ncbi:FIVAR domain-containing protein [Gardnerella vaginalis]|uniref:Peptidase n=1 Tax=Gardnerella vaginalis TaxID=2702 RepID=A0A3E1IYH7_GARVA|nr:FIVAR domain-containing protein [Gardnerella vaginalis]RFD78027.1 peptidase [Gardnerella vaginalis]
MTTKSGKHANKIAKNAFDSATNNGVTKAVDMRKVAALSAGAAGVIAGAAIAFGATPAMAADTTSTPVDTSTSANAQDLTAKKSDEKQKSDEEQQADEANKKTTDSTPAPDNTTSKASTYAASNTPAEASAGPNYGQVREADPAPAPKVNSTIELSQDKKDTLPNMYAWGSSDNVYIEKGQNQKVTFKFAKPSDGSTITKVAIFPSDTNGVENAKSRGFLEYYSADANAHQSYSGTYDFNVNNDGSATLAMTKLYRDGGLNGAQGYAANRCIYVYGTKDGQEVLLYKTNIARAATLVPPKTAGSIVLKYNEELTAQQIQDKLKAALDAPTEATGKKSIREQITAASTSRGVGGRTGENGAFVQTPDTADKKVVITDNQAYDTKQVETINTVTSKQGDKVTTYKTGAQKLDTYLISDLGYKSDVLPLTVARYDTRIDKPTVEDLSKVSDEVKTEIKKKLARLNNVPEDKVTIGADGTFTINFDGVDPNDAPKIALRDLVLKKLEEKDVTVPTGDKAVFVANPLGYSNAELDRIKTAIFNANKDNKELGLTSIDQISLSYITGDLTGAGDANKGRSNGLQENNISVTIKTDKAVAEFASDIIKDKLTRLPDIRKDYTVELVKNKLDGRDSDEGFSWSDDKHTTLIYRYDPTKTQAFTAPEILKLIKATPKGQNTGLRDLTGGEVLGHEGANGKPRKSHVYYVIDNNGEPTTELTLGMMSGPYWIGNPQVANSDVNMGNEESKVGQYTWDTEAGSVTVASKQNKVFKTRLFVAPYTLTYYRGVYTNPYQKDPNNTPKAINIIFVPQTNHKTSDLQKSIGEHATTQVEGKDIPTDSKYYNASDKVKKDYEDALKVAKQTLEKVGKTADADLTEDLKAEVDNATIKLDKARKALDGDATKKEELNKSIEANGKAQEGATAATPGTVTTDRYKNVTEPDFKTPDGKADTKKNEAAKKAKEDYDKALEDAKALKADDNAAQKDVDAAKAKLDAAREKLNEFSTNKDKLNAAIAEHGQVKTGDTSKQGKEKLKTADPAYQNATDDERKAYDDAVKKANELSKDPNASQKDVNEAITALEAAKKALDAKATDKSQLIAAEKLSFDNPDKTDASKQSTFYKNAKAKADGNDQAATTAVENYDNALQKAREVIADKNATQAQVNAAKDALTKAEDALHKDYATDTNELTKVLADNFSGYLMPAYFNAFDKAQAGDAEAKKAFKDYNDAYQKAKELKKALEDAKNAGTAPDQNQINEAKKALEEARKVIDKYATNTSRLSAAAFNDLAIQNSPAYKNVKELADKQNPSEEEKAKVEAAKKAKEAYEAAVDKLHKALNNQLPKDKANGQDIPDGNTPKKDGDLNSKDYLKDIQAHKNGEPLNRDVDTILKEMNEAAKALDKFATKTDELIKSINEDATTHPSPAFKNASQPSFQKPDGSGPDDAKNAAAKAAADAYGKALNEAKDLLKKPDATQKEVNDALKKLDDARKELDKYNTDTTKLDESVKKHGSTEGPAATEGTQTSDAYRNASDPHFMKEQDGKLVPDTDKNTKAAAAKKAYDEALTKAQELLKKHGDKDTPQDAKPTQKEIDEALKTLDEARKKLEDNYKTVTTGLEKEINKSTPEGAPAVTEDDFENTPEFKNAKAKTSDGNENADVTAYKEALKKARDLVKAAADQDKKNSERPSQQQINDALDALKAAKKQIEDNYKTNLEPLTSAKDFAGGDFKKTPEYQNAVAKKDAGDQGAIAALGKDGEQTGFDNVLKKVTDKLNDEDWKKKATQKDVNALLKQLKDAQDNIAKKYKTDAIKLEREVGDKDQDGKPVVPPFESSVAYKNALEKAKTEDPATTDANSATKRLAAYVEKLAKANELIEKVKNPDPNAKPEDRPTQKQVDDALAALKKAKKDIDDNFKTKVDKLQNEVDDKNEDGTARTPKFEESTEFANLKGKTKDGKKPDDLVAYEQALAKAKELIDKNDGKVTKDGQEVDVPKDQLPTQQEVDEAKKALKEIKDKILANYKTDPVELQKEVDKSKDGDDDQRDTTFENTPEFKNADAKKGEEGKDNADMAAYKKALDDAKNLLDKFDRTTGKPKTDLPAGEKAPTQKQLDDALDALKAAKKKITDGYKTNPSKLKSEADADPDFTKTPEYVNAQAKGDDASKKDLEAYKKALDDANKVLGDKNATQKQVDDALKKLQDAKSKLTDGYKTDKNKLYQETGNDPEFRKSIPFLIADSKDIAEYNKALNDANAVLADPNATQAQVDEALRKLQRIKQKMIDLYNSLGSGSDDDSDGGSTGANNANANAVDKSMLHAEVNGALADVANGAGAAGAANGAKGSRGALVDASVIKEFNDALENARRVLADPNATQEQVEAATMRLRAARAALNAAKANKGSNLRGNMGVQTGVDSATLSAFAAVFVGLAGLGVSAKRRKHAR